MWIIDEYAKINGERKTMMEKTSLEITLEVVCGKWKGYILWVLLQNESIRFNELQRLIGRNISARILSRELKMLLEDGLVDRIEHNEAPPKVEYKVTPYGKTTLPFLTLMNEWGEKHKNLDLSKEEMSEMINKTAEN